MKLSKIKEWFENNGYEVVINRLPGWEKRPEVKLAVEYAIKNKSVFHGRFYVDFNDKYITSDCYHSLIGIGECCMFTQELKINKGTIIEDDLIEKEI